MNLQSIKTRFLVSFLSNGIRATLSFASGVMIARYLGPADYGNFTFIFGSFLAISALIDAGSSSAFYTYISQEENNNNLIISYFYWIIAQFILVLIFIIFLFESNLYEYIWPLQNKITIILGFIAIFLQQKIWQTVSQIGEAKRKTVLIQITNIFISSIYFILIYIYTNMSILDINNIFIILIFLNMTFSILTIALNYKYTIIKFNISLVNLNIIYKRYKEYCKPLIFFSLIVFANEFSEKWMIQYFGGSIQQGYYNISSQFSTITLLATTSIITIFWKEISNARKQGDIKKIQELYKKVNKRIVIFGAIVCGALMPWTEEIINIFLGNKYKDASIILSIMFFYPIHQAMGQVGGAMLLAEGRTKQYVYIGMVSILLSMPISYFILAPRDFGIIGGFDFGAEGMAIKLVLVNILSVNLMAWYISKVNNWNFDWKFQAFDIPIIILCGLFIKKITNKLQPFGSENIIEQFSIFIIIYLFTILLVINLKPSIVGWKNTKDE